MGKTTRRKSETPSEYPSKKPVLAVGTKVEVKINLEGFIGSWFEAVILDHVMKSGRLVRYLVKYLTLVKEEDPEIHETEKVSLENVRPEAPRRNGNEKEDQEFEMHDLVEAYHNDGWWYGVISRLKNQTNGKYTVSFPFTREIIDFPPSEIRPQLDYVNGSFVPLRRKTPQEEEETYKIGDKVETRIRREKYGLSWYPAKIKKKIGDDYFLVKYENTNYLPNKCKKEILDFQVLRPIVDRSTKTNPIAVGSNVEFYHEGAWSTGVVTSALPEGIFVINATDDGEDGNNLLSVHINEEFVRLRLKWDWEDKKWEDFNTPRKRGRRSFGTPKNYSADKKQKIDLPKDSPSEKTMEKKEAPQPEKAESGPAKPGTFMQYSRMKRAVSKISPNRLLMKSSPALLGKMISDIGKPQGDASADISKGEMVNPPQKTPTPQQPLSVSAISDDVFVTPPPAEQTPSSSLDPNIILPFEMKSPIWKSLLALPIFKRIPQKPHFSNLDTKEFREGVALGIMANYAILADSIPSLSLNDDVAVFEEKLSHLSSFETNGLNVDPLRTRITSLLELKKEIIEKDSKVAEKEREIAKRHENNNSVLANLDKIGGEVAEIKNKISKLQAEEKKLRAKREKCLEISVKNKDSISRIRDEINRLCMAEEAAREKFLVTAKEPLRK